MENPIGRKDRSDHPSDAELVASLSNPNGDFECPIAAWALVEDEAGDRYIEPVDPTGGGWDGGTMSGQQQYEIVYRPAGPPSESLWNPPPQDGALP